VHEYVSLYPLTWELIFGDAMVLGGAVAAKLVHFACLPALAVLVGLAARRFTPDASIAAVVAILVTTPTLLWESSTAYVDLALALHSAAACYALARYVQSQESAWRTVAALQFGMAAATKHLGVIFAVVALMLYILSTERSPAGLVSRLRSAIVMALIAAAVPLPWYLRAWVASGNPVFPEMFALFGAFPSWRWDAATEQGLTGFKAHFGMGRSPAALLALPWNVTVHGALFSGSLGPLFLVLVPGLLRSGHRAVSAVRWLVCGVVVYAAIWASPISSFQMRFLMPVIAPLALLAGVALERADRAGWNAAPRRGALVEVVLAGLAALNLPPFVPWHEVDRRGWNGWLTHVVRSAPLRVLTGNESEATYLSREVPSFAAWRWINAHLPDDARVLAFSGGDQFYAARFRISFDATIAREAVWGGGSQSEADAVSHLRRLGITHVLFDRRVLTAANAERLSILSPQVQQACVPEYDDGRYWLCRLDYGRLVETKPGAATER
jgi:4-amino-4-deoxy-L-arabinose transferase-like glycosyltransferase